LAIQEMPTEGRGTAHFSQILISLSTGAKAPLDLGTIIHALGQRSIGALMLFFALPMALPIPMPGISVLFGIPLLLISAQLFFGNQSVWLPARLAKRMIAPGDLSKYVGKAMPTLRRVESVLRARIPVMVGEGATKLVAAVSMVLALIIILPIPFGHFLPGTAISFMALGLIERDGAAVGAGLATGLVALAVIALAISGLAGIARSVL
jgi:hypothetical protein